MNAARKLYEVGGRKCYPNFNDYIAWLEARAVMVEELLDAIQESLTWETEGEFGDGVPLESCTPAYRASILNRRALLEKFGKSPPADLTTPQS